MQPFLHLICRVVNIVIYSHVLFKSMCMQYFTKTQLVALTLRLYAGEGGGVADKEVSSSHGGEGAAWNIFHGATTFRKGGTEQEKEYIRIQKRQPHLAEDLSSLLCDVDLWTGEQLLDCSLNYSSLNWQMHMNLRNRLRGLDCYLRNRSI